MINRIVIEEVDQATPGDPEQVGDWQFVGDELLIRVSRLDSSIQFIAVGIHELIEAYLCRRDKIRDEVVTAFDQMWKLEEDRGMIHRTEEPGDDPRSPYRSQHLTAMHVERSVVDAISGSWEAYCSLLEKEAPPVAQAGGASTP